MWAEIEDGIDRIGRDPKGAQQAFARALRLDPGNGLAMKYLADISFRAGQLREARDGYRRAIAARLPPSGRVRQPGGDRGARRTARRSARRADRRRAADRRATPTRGTAWDCSRRGAATSTPRGARSRARSPAEPGRAEPYYNLGVIERRAGNEAAAQARLKEALARNPAYPEAHYELGTGYLRARQPEPALTAYRAALAARPDYAEALFGAARAALDLGRPDEARRDYERFVQVAPPEYAQQIAAAREALRAPRTAPLTARTSPQ